VVIGRLYADVLEALVVVGKYSKAVSGAVEKAAFATALVVG